MVKLGIYAGLTALGVLFAFHADRRERREAIQASLILVLVWIFYVMPWIYPPASIAGMLYTLGFPAVDHDQTYPAIDLVASMAMLRVARHHVWGWVIWSGFMGAMCCHVAYQVLNWVGSPLEYSAYTGGLDAAYTAQLAMLLLLGEGGVRSRVSRCLRRIRGSSLPKLAHAEG